MFADGIGPVAAELTARGIQLSRSGFHIEVDGDCQGVVGQVAIDPALAIECVQQAIGRDLVVELEDDVTQPVLFRSATNGTFVSLLMPVAV